MLLLSAMIMNFFAIMGLTLFAPLFEQTKSLGITKYGITMEVMIFGSIIGMILLSVLKLKPNNRFVVFALSTIAMCIFMISTGLSYNFISIIIFAMFTGASNIIVNIIFQTVVQITTPQEYRCKVFGIISTVTGALSPISMAICGFTVQVFGVRNTIVVSFIMAAACMIPLLLNSSFKKFINFNIQDQTNSENNVNCTADTGRVQIVSQQSATSSIKTPQINNRE